MLKNYIMVALRSLRRERLYAGINVIGLAVALTICLLVFAYVKHELSFDRFHENGDRLYRINYLIPESGGKLTPSAGTAFPLGPILRERLPEVDMAVQLASLSSAIVRLQSASFSEPVQFADSQFFSMFTFPLVAGSATTALASPNSVVLTERLASKYFGSEPALGKWLSIEIDGKKEDYQVTGVCQNPPGNSSIDFGMVLPVRKLIALYQSMFEFGWNLTWPSTYVLLRPGVSLNGINEKLATLAKTLPLDNTDKSKMLLGAQPIAAIHFDYAINNSPDNVGRPLYSYVLAGIAALVLTLACINFMTLAIGRSQTRTKEVGIRKVMGARIEQLLGRFLGEAAVLCTLATVLAFVLAELLLPAFNDLAGKRIEHTIWLDWATLAGAILLVAITSVLAGGYPAAVLSRTRLRDAVKGKARLLTGGGVTRVLVALQFGLSIALIIATLVMSGQLRYMQSVSIGFDKEHLLLVKLAGTGPEKMRMVGLLRNNLANNSNVLSVCGAGRSLDGRGMSNCDYLPDSTLFCVCANPADEYFVKTMGLTIIEGSNFTGSALPDSLEPLLVNETLVRTLKWKSAIGQKVPGITGARVIGVVNDFNIASLVEPIQPVVIPYADPDNWGANVRFAYVRLKPGPLAATVESIREAWEKSTPNLPFDFQFMDDHIDAQYRFEQRWWKIVGYSSALAILIACFGAFGLTALAVARRQKEIGVRKVLGASSGQIVSLLNKEFIWLVAIGNLLAWPAAYFAISKWLEGFAYHISPSLWAFAGAAIVTVLVVVVTVSAQAIRAARTNPVESLRYE